ncbi:hypothetical protein F8388_026719 [Cannabis sativa]|uniref:CCHC-type domain-containing protein n=1 Tax=Cannabis sativa TaxID=3483 RepID=A0A7J6H381_CANSA|nr:hypothetical protein F8388_026719 [Cannabis sativa]
MVLPLHGWLSQEVLESMYMWLSQEVLANKYMEGLKPTIRAKMQIMNPQGLMKMEATLMVEVKNRVMQLDQNMLGENWTRPINLVLVYTRAKFSSIKFILPSPTWTEPMSQRLAEQRQLNLSTLLGDYTYWDSMASPEDMEEMWNNPEVFKEWSKSGEKKGKVRFSQDEKKRPYLSRIEVKAVAEIILSKHFSTKGLKPSVLCALAELLSMRFVYGIGPNAGIMGLDYSTAFWLYMELGFRAYKVDSIDDLTKPFVSMYFGAAYFLWLSEYEGRERTPQFVVQAYIAGPKNVNFQETGPMWLKFEEALRIKGAASSLSVGLVMEVVIANKHSAKGKSLSCSEATVTLNPSASSLKVLTTFCLFGKVVAPMSVEVTTVQEFVDKTWHIPVSIVAIPGEAFNSNYFELGFNDEEVRTWALEKGPWCVRGYTLVLQAWSPREGGKLQFTHLKLCIQIHNLPHEYFSVDNGKFLGSLAGEVLQVDLDEDKPASWNNFLKVWVVIDIAEPLFSGCFFDLASGVKIWLQFKFERIGIFCYNCGCLGHQRRGCSLSSPVTVEKGNGIPFPLFGLWISTSSSYLDVFSGANTFVPSRGFSSTFPQHRLPGLASSASKGGNGVISRRTAPNVGGFSRMSKRVTRRSPASMGFPKSAAWVPRSQQDGGTAKISGNGNGVLGEQIENGKASENFPDISLRKTLHCFSNSVRNSNPPNVSEAVKETHHVMHVQKEVGSVLRGPFEDQQMGNGPFNCGLQVTINKSHGEGCSQRFIGPVGSGLQDTNNDIPTSVGPTIPINVLKRSVILKDGPENPNRGLIQMKGNINKLSGGSYLSNVGHDSLEALGPDGLSKESIEGQDVVSGLDEKKALASFFQAQETLLHELKHFGNLDLYEIKQLGGDIGVKPTSETNERVTPFKKRKFFESSASLCSRPHKIIRRHPGVIRDFPWDSEKIETADKNDVEDPSEDTSCSLSCPEVGGDADDADKVVTAVPAADVNPSEAVGGSDKNVKDVEKPKGDESRLKGDDFFDGLSQLEIDDDQVVLAGLEAVGKIHVPAPNPDVVGQKSDALHTDEETEDTVSDTPLLDKRKRAPALKSPFFDFGSADVGSTPMELMSSGSQSAGDDRDFKMVTYVKGLYALNDVFADPVSTEIEAKFDAWIGHPRARIYIVQISNFGVDF